MRRNNEIILFNNEVPTKPDLISIPRPVSVFEANEKLFLYLTFILILEACSGIDSVL